MQHQGQILRISPQARAMLLFPCLQELWLSLHEVAGYTTGYLILYTICSWPARVVHWGSRRLARQVNDLASWSAWARRHYYSWLVHFTEYIHAGKTLSQPNGYSNGNRQWGWRTRTGGGWVVPSPISVLASPSHSPWGDDEWYMAWCCSEVGRLVKFWAA